MIDQAIYKLIGREKITDLSVAVGFGAAYIPPTQKNTIFAQLQVQTSDMRYYTSGDTPDASNGWYLATNGIIEVWGARALRDFLCINDTATSAIEVRYYGR